jgi:hypothetical protein
VCKFEPPHISCPSGQALEVLCNTVLTRLTAMDKLKGQLLSCSIAGTFAATVVSQAYNLKIINILISRFGLGEFIATLSLFCSFNTLAYILPRVHVGLTSSNTSYTCSVDTSGPSPQPAQYEKKRQLRLLSILKVSF